MKTSIRIIFAALLLASISSFAFIKTQIAITILDELGNAVQGAKVTLYETEEDYTKEENGVAEGLTDDRGIIKFKELKPISYYIIARKDDKDNSDGGERTGKLEGNRINKVNIVIQ